MSSLIRLQMMWIRLTFHKSNLLLFFFRVRVAWSIRLFYLFYRKWTWTATELFPWTSFFRFVSRTKASADLSPLSLTFRFKSFQLKVSNEKSQSNCLSRNVHDISIKRFNLKLYDTTNLKIVLKRKKKIIFFKAKIPIQ
jgi:hypothetical protein